jgi:uncharacterized protein (TIGR03083 family)
VRADVTDLARAERADLAALLRELTPEQWEAPSLCAEWPVRDVVAHVVSYEELDSHGILRRYVRGRFLPHRATDRRVRAHPGPPPRRHRLRLGGGEGRRGQRAR